MTREKRKRERRLVRHRRVRRKVQGTSERPRLCVFRSNRNIHCQVIDDWSGRTLAHASTLSGSLKEELSHGGNTEAAARVGELIARECLQKGITRVVFDRGGYKFHGRVRALAEAARKGFEEAGAEGF